MMRSRAELSPVHGALHPAAADVGQVAKRMRIGKADRYYLIFHDLAPHLEDAHAKLGQLVQQEHFYEIIYISNPFAFPALSYNTFLWKNAYKN